MNASGVYNCLLWLVYRVALFHWQVNYFLCFEIGLFEKVGYVIEPYFFVKWSYLIVKVSTLKINDTIVELVIMGVGNLTLDPSYELREVGDSSRNNKIEIFFDLLGTNLLSFDVCQFELCCYVVDYFYLFTYRVDKIEVGVREHDGQRYAWESAASAKVHDVTHGLKLNDFGNGKTVEHMVLHKIVHVFARDNVDFTIPVGV